MDTDKDKSIFEKFTDTVKEITNTATEAAGQALKTSRADERAAAYVPLAADGLVSDPLMVPPAAAAPRAATASPAGRTRSGSCGGGRL